MATRTELLRRRRGYLDLKKRIQASTSTRTNQESSDLQRIEDAVGEIDKQLVEATD